MGTNIKMVLRWLLLSILMMIFWIVGLLIGNALFPNSLMEMEVDSSASPELMLFVASALNAGVIMLLIYNSRLKGWRLVGSIFLISFGIQYFMSQIETLWFNDSLQLPGNGISAIVVGGAIMCFLFSVVATWVSGKFKGTSESTKDKVVIGPMLKKIILLSVLVWPFIYFMFGYLVAWQFDEVGEKAIKSNYSKMFSKAWSTLK